jgi:hypothetical protein
MPTYCTSLLFKGVCQGQIVKAIQDHLPHHKCFVSPQLNGWVTVFDADCDEVSVPNMMKVAGTISRVCSCHALVLGVYRSKFLAYWILNIRGEVEDYSCPADFENPTPQEEHGLAGNLESIVALYELTLSVEDVRWTLTHLEPATALDTLMGEMLNNYNATLDYSIIAEGHEDFEEMELLVEGWKDFIHIGGEPRKNFARKWLG